MFVYMQYGQSTPKHFLADLNLDSDRYARTFESDIRKANKKFQALQKCELYEKRTTFGEKVNIASEFIYTVLCDYSDCVINVRLLNKQMHESANINGTNPTWIAGCLLASKKYKTEHFNGKEY